LKPLPPVRGKRPEGSTLGVYPEGGMGVLTYEVYKDNKLISYYFLDAFYTEEKRP